MSLSGLSSSTTSIQLLRMTAPLATSLVADVTIGGSGAFSDSCDLSGSRNLETVDACNGQTIVEMNASEAVIIYLT